MKGKKFDAAFKQETIKKVIEQGKGVSAVAEELGIHIKTMYRWLDEYKQDGDNGFPGKGKQKPDDEELRRVKREKKDLREENEILKKVASSLQDTQNEICIYI
jgi:transposase